MGGIGMRRVTEVTQDEGRPDTDNWRTDWFAEQLGERWQTTGDGIYTYVPAEPGSAGSRYTSIQPLVGISPSTRRAPTSQ
jgi:hypothetical protein